MGHKMRQSELEQASGVKPYFSGLHADEVGNLWLVSDFETNNSKSFNCLNLTQQRDPSRTDQLIGLNNQSVIYPCKKVNDKNKVNSILGWDSKFCGCPDDHQIAPLAPQICAREVILGSSPAGM